MHLLQTSSYQSLVAGQQPPIIAHQPAATNHLLQTKSYQSLVAGQQPPIIAHQPAATNHLLQTKSYQSIVAGQQPPIIAHQPGLGVVAAGGATSYKQLVVAQRMDWGLWLLGEPRATSSWWWRNAWTGGCGCWGWRPAGRLARQACCRLAGRPAGRLARQACCRLAG